MTPLQKQIEQLRKRQAQLITALNGHECACGKTKAAGTSFCKGCYYALPEPMRYALYRRMGQGYEHAYDKALNQLGLTDHQ